MQADVAHGRLVSIQTTNERGGAEYANVDLLAALQRRGRDVLLLTNVPEIAASSGVPVREVQLGAKLSSRSVGTTLRSAPLTLWRTARGLRAARPVAVTLLHFKKEQLLCSLLPRRLTGAIVWAEWGPVPAQLRHGLPRLLYALAARRTRRILAVSQGTKESVVAAGVASARVMVVPNLIDLDALRFDPTARLSRRADWGASEETFVIGCISRFQRRKRNDVVIDAMRFLTGDVMLVVAGEGEEEAELHRRASASGGQVRFVPSPRGHVNEFLSACDVLAFAPSPTEGAPRVVIESQLVGVPVIATDSEGAGELIPPGGGMVVTPSHDPRALAEALAAYRDDPVRRRQEGEAAQTWTRTHHDPDRILRAVEEALD